MASQDEYDREFLEYEDPAIYKALMQQEASERPAPIVSDDTPYFQNLPDNVYRSGEGRRAVASALGNIIGDDYATGLIGGDQNKYAGLGALDVVGIGGAIDFADSWKFFNKINADKARVENELIQEGYDPNSESFDDEVTNRMPEYHGKGEAFFHSLLAPIEIATLGATTKMVAGGRIVKNALNKKIDMIGRKLMSLKGAPGALPVVTEATSGALPSNNMSDSIQALRDSASKLKSEKGALPVSSKPTVAELRREANIRRFGYDPNDILDTPVVRTATDDAGFESYLEEVNPNFKRIAAEDRPNLMMGDMYGMLPRNSEVVGSQGKVTFHRATNGDHYATAYNPDVGEEDVIGYITNRGDGTELAVVQEMQGQGIGGELQYLFRQENPKALTGGLTESGERSLQRTYDRLLEERPDNLTDSIKALQGSAESLKSKKGALPDNVASFSDAQNNQMISKIKGVLEDMPYTINLPYEIGKKLNSEGRLPLPIGTNMIPPIGKGSPEDVYKISGYKADPNNTNVYGYEITSREGDVSYIGVSDPKMGIKEKKLDMISGWKAALGPEGSKRLNYTPPDWQLTKKP